MRRPTRRDNPTQKRQGKKDISAHKSKVLKKENERLDEALKETFPASDAIAQY